MTGAFTSAVYEGRIRHRRFEPVSRSFEYRIHMMYLDLSEMSEVMRIHPLWSTRPRSPATLRRADYLGDPDRPLDQSVRDLVEERTGSRPGGPIRMLTHLRYWGVCFNPVTMYYCFDRDGRELDAVVAEVTNTPWGERHAYVADRAGRGRALSLTASKALHVSPLMGMDHRYELVFGKPGETISVHMESHRADRLHFDATLRLHRRELSREVLGGLLTRRIPIPVKVLGGIHLEAARTWLAGARFHRHPDPIGADDLPDPEKEGMLCPVGRSSGKGSSRIAARSGR